MASARLTMVKQTILAALCFIFFFSSSHSLAGLKSFSSTSLASIEASRAGEAFILLLWSIECPPCLKELRSLEALKDQGLEKRVVLISTDGQDYQQEISDFLATINLAGYEQWLFSQDLPERLRYVIDPSWYGELPRAYFYNAEGARVAHSGMLKTETLEAWLKQTNSLDGQMEAQSNEHF